LKDKRRKVVALKYNPETDKAPLVVAKGKGELARRILEVAKREGIPVVEDEPLVEALLRVEIFEEIPPQLYEAIARILVFVQDIKKRSF